MKKLLTLSLAILFVLGFSMVAFAGNGVGVSGSVHDMRLTAIGGTELCGYCHAPHSQGRAESTDGPLWAHTQPDTTGYTMYTYTSEDGVTDSEPTGISKACLGCHDGTVALDEYQDVTAATTTIIDVRPSAQVPNVAVGTQDLSGTHPISVTYVEQDSYGNTILNAPTSPFGTAGSIADYLQGGKVQCSTCHDVHDDVVDSVVGTPLLRVTDSGSTLCVTCHNK